MRVRVWGKARGGEGWGGTGARAAEGCLPELRSLDGLLLEACSLVDSCDRTLLVLVDRWCSFDVTTGRKARQSCHLVRARSKASVRVGVDQPRRAVARGGW